MKFSTHAEALVLVSVLSVAPCGRCDDAQGIGQVSMLAPQPSYDGQVSPVPGAPGTTPALRTGDGQAAPLADWVPSATTAVPPSVQQPPLLGFLADIPLIAPGYILLIALAGAAVCACRGAFAKRARRKAERGSDYSAVNSSEIDGLLGGSAPEGVEHHGGSDSGEESESTIWGVSESALAGTPIILAPLRILGEAIRVKVLSGGVQGRRHAAADDEETGGRGLYDEHTEEETRGLLQEGPDTRREEDEKETSSAAPARSPPRRSPYSSPKREKASPKRRLDDSDDDIIDTDDQAAVEALMKLRPAAWDSLGHDEEDDDMATRPLIGSERANYLSR